MPRKPSHPHVLRDLRNTIGKTQAEFATMVGVKPITINRIENGTLAISALLSIRIQVQTGISISELAKGRRGKLIDHFGGRYTADRFAWWRKKFRRASEDNAIEAARNLGWWMEVLLRSAARSRNGASYNGVVAALIQSLGAIRSDFGLTAMTNELLQKERPVVEWQPGARTPSELREIQEELAADLAREDRPDPRRVRWLPIKPRKSKRSSGRRRARA